MTSFFDAHLDLAYLHLNGREMTAALSEAQGKPQPAAVTLQSLAEGNVKWAFATIYTAPSATITEPDRPPGPDPSDGPAGYPAGDHQAAHERGVAQLDIYRRWEDEGHISIVRSRQGLVDTPTDGSPIQIILLMEGADPIRDVGEVAWWHDQGLRAVGLSWWRGTTYAGGNGHHYPLTPEGKEMVAALDDVGIIHDLSHLSDDAAAELLGIARGPVIASHSNARALMDGKNHRHLSDDLIKEISSRDGVIGLNLASKFLTTQDRPATIQETLGHVDHIADVAAGRSRVGLGSDMDGGFGADKLPDGIDQPSDLQRLVEGLAERGWTTDELEGFASRNWLTLLRRTWG